MLDLVTLFDALLPPLASQDQGARFSAQPIPGYERHRLGKDLHGGPSILISIGEASGDQRVAPIVLAHLTVQNDIDCRIYRLDNSVEEGRFTVVRCTGADRALHVYFLRIVAPVIMALGASPSRAEVSEAINKLAELFHAITRAPRKSLQGLWAELFLIARARDPLMLVKAWHVLPEDRYDFSAGGQRIEVKSASGRIRQHHFTLEQLHPPAGTSVLVASLFVERAGAGTSIAELIEEVRSRVSSDPTLVLQVDRIVGLTLGESWQHAMEDRFDRELAEESLAFFATEDIPKVSPEVPFGVSGISFKSDLTGHDSSDLASLRASEGLFRAVLRR